MDIKRSVLIVLALVVMPQFAIARTIWLAGNHHEVMMLDSMYCAEESSSLPVSCSERPAKWKGGLDLSKIDLGTFSQEQAEIAVRYPDDPVSELGFGNPVGLVRWGWNMGISACEGKNRDITTGLRCSTHYGDFQFMHAMSAKEGLKAEVTKYEINAWIRYLLLIIQNKTQPSGVSFIEQNYCEYWRKELQIGNPIAQVMVPQGMNAFPCVVKNGLPWTIASMFAFDCKTNIYLCDVDLSSKNIKRKAIGSILHLIQDSFSQGHALRGDCCEGVPDMDLAAYQCLEIKQFNVYQNQIKRRHKYADKKPFSGESCNGRSDIHDPIVSGASVLWVLKNSGASDESISDVMAYLDRSVFRLSVNSAPSSSGAGF